MNILVVNCGSSSQGFKLYKAESGEVLLTGKARNVATKTQSEPAIEWKVAGSVSRKSVPLPSHAAAAHEMLSLLKGNGFDVDAIGHRFVHGGDLFQHSVRVDEKSLPGLRQCLPLAPIHNPNSMSVIDVCAQELPDVPQYVVFDTAFHAHMPVEARHYALPLEITEKYGFYKYGFHGLSYQYVSARAARLLERPLEQVRLIMCHLGTGGSSVAAFRDGHSVETSMGYSPVSGLVMSTRCGDIDAEVVLDLVRQGFSTDEVERLLNNQSGLVGLSGFSSNLAEIITAAEQGNDRCRLAYEVYANRLKFYLGAYTWLLNGADAIVFTDDIGCSSWRLREKVLSGVQNLGIALDDKKNREVGPGREEFINLALSPTKILVIPTDEERVIFDEVIRFQEGKS